MEVKGIICDNKECDFEDESVQFDDYPNWLNKPCPKCGENLLTQEDLNTVKMLMTLTSSQEFKDLEKNLEKLLPEQDKKNYVGKMNGSGTIEFEEEKKDK